MEFALLDKGLSAVVVPLLLRNPDITISGVKDEHSTIGVYSKLGMEVLEQ